MPDSACVWMSLGSYGPSSKYPALWGGGSAAMTRKKLWTSTMIIVSFAGTIAMGRPLWAVNPWERWQLDSPLISNQSLLTPLQAYHDVQVEATFWLKSGSTCTEPATCTNPNSCF